jgi:methylenetetrahydrofolate reductase (NADPH)
VFFDWLSAARRVGIDVPIIPGVMPITSYAQIKRFCEICQATIPGPLADAMEALGGDDRAEHELGIAYAARQCDELLAAGVPGIHFYTLNRAPATRAILGAIRASRPWERAPSEPAAVAPS